MFGNNKFAQVPFAQSDANQELIIIDTVWVNHCVDMSTFANQEQYSATWDNQVKDESHWIDSTTKTSEIVKCNR